MTSTERLNLMKDRLGRLQNSPKNIKCPGVVRKLSRQVRKMDTLA